MASDRVIVRYLGRRVGSFTVTVGSEEFLFSAADPEREMTPQQASFLIARAGQEFRVMGRASQVRPQTQPRSQTNQTSPRPVAAQESASADGLPPGIAAMRAGKLAAMNGQRVHAPGCRYYPLYPDVLFDSPDEAVSAGFELCAQKTCFPKGGTDAPADP